MRKIAYLLLFAAFVGAPRALLADELSLAEALAAAERNSPHLRASDLQEQAALKGIKAAESAYYPSVSAGGSDSWGFPGSNGALGVQGLAGSPLKSGLAGGLAASYTVFDFGRTDSQIETARSAAAYQRGQGKVDAYNVDLDLLHTFYDCSRYRSEYQNWNDLYGKTQLVATEVFHFVDNGQRSIVDRYLSEAQVEQAKTYLAYFQSRMGSTVKRLALLTGLPETGLSCPSLPISDPAPPVLGPESANPYILRAEAEKNLARYRVSAAKADYLPKIVGATSVGAMERSVTDRVTDYSGAIGVVVPLFDGLGTVYRVQQARSELAAKTQQLAAVQLDMNEANARYDEIIDASKARLEHLRNERQLAEEALRVAQSRYFKFEGTLVDLRDAVDNLGRIETDMSDAQADLLQAAGSKALLNGARKFSDN